MDFEACTTPSRRKRHYSIDMRPRSADGHTTAAIERYGRTLCGERARDEGWANRHYATAWGRFRIVLADLPECMRCARTKERAS
jgi:hypothetical protein